MDGRTRAPRGRRRSTPCCAERAPWAADRDRAGDRQRVVRALELLDAGELEPPEAGSELWTATVRHPTLLIGLVMERQRLYARIDRRVEEMVAAGAREEVRRAAAAGASNDRAKGARLRRAVGRRRRGDEAAHPQLRPPAADLDAQARQGRGARRHRRPDRPPASAARGRGGAERACWVREAE